MKIHDRLIKSPHVFTLEDSGDEDDSDQDIHEINSTDEEVDLSLNAMTGAKKPAIMKLMA